jgi:hypothetical protein
MSRPTRRGFLTALGALAGGAVLPRALAGAPDAAQNGWDLSWLDDLRGKHRQVFDMSNMEIGLLVVRNWLDAHQSVFGLEYPQVNAVIGIGGHAFPINASDAMYARYPIGELWKVTDPTTGKPALRNIFLEGGSGAGEQGASVRALQARGAIFWQCNNALHGVAARIAATVQRPDAEVYAALRAGLNPKVILVPAHTMLIGLAQEHGCAYEAL